MTSSGSAVMLILLLLALSLMNGHCYQYKVGDLDAWGLPPSSNPHVYAFWSQKYNFRIGDSLLFLYPPSQDSVVQVTETAFNSCDIADPILRMADGNSVFNITGPGRFYFTSGAAGHCQKQQRLQIAVPTANGTFFPPDAGVLPATAPMYPNVFGPTTQPSDGASIRVSLVVVAAAIVGALLSAM